MSTDLGTKDRRNFDPAAWISQTEAAKLRKVSRQAIANLVKKNRFRTLEIAGKILLSRLEVEAYQPTAPGPKPKRKRRK
jgi:hypothetical protein